VTLERLHGLKRYIFWLLWYWLPEKRCTAIVAISEATKEQILHHLSCDEKKITIIHDNVSEEFKPAPKPFNQRRPRLLQIGTKTNKNLERIAEALTGLSCKLVIIGKLSDTQILNLQRYGISYENYVGLSRQELVEQYCLCDMLLFVSIYEGFGLPIVEANAVGRPMVTSNCWSMPEVADDAACLVDPFDVTSIRAGILRVIDDSAYREHLVISGFENVKRFRIEKIAAQYTELYRRVYASTFTQK